MAAALAKSGPDSDPAIFVTDGATRQALAVVRALGRRGHAVHVLTTAPRSLAGVSRFAAAEHLTPGTEREPRAWHAAVQALLARHPGALLLPVSEVALGTLFRFGCPETVIGPPREAYERSVDKYELLALAREAGLEVPPTTLVEDVASLRTLPAGHRYPVVVKARRSRWLVEDHWQRGTVHVARNQAELELLRGEGGLAGGALVQDFLPGTGEGVFLLAARGRSLVRFAHRRVREKPPGGGVSVVSESIAPDPAVVTPCERLLAALGWHGVAMLEFRRTPDGRALLMELNPRLWGSLQLAIDAGIDFPSLLVALHRGEDIPALEARPGVRLRWLLGDLDRTWIALRRRDQRVEPRRRTLARLLAEFGSGARSEVLRWDDPRPFARELRLWLSRREAAL